jgi:hypothetical protein
MQSPRRRMWSFAAALAVAAALLGVAGTPTGGVTGAGYDGASLSQPARWPGALQAILRPNLDAVESTIQSQKPFGTRLLILLAWSFSALGLFELARAPRPPLAPGPRPSVVRLRRWLSLRAPPPSPVR